jgi:importin-9
VTRSRSKQSTPDFLSSYRAAPIADFLTPLYKDPDQFTAVSASLKILKVLIQELLSSQGKLGSAAANAAAAVAAEYDTVEDDGDNDWEDDPNTVDLSLGATKHDLLNFIESSGSRMRDDETQAYLTDFFLRAARDNTANFKEWYEALNEEEKAKLQELAAQ